MIRIRNAALSLLALQPHSLSMPALREALATHPALAGLDETLPVVLDLSAVDSHEVDWPAVREALRSAHLQPVGVRNGPAALRAQASVDGWADLGLTAPNLLANASPAAEPEIAQAAVATASTSDVAAVQNPLAAAPTLIIDRPLRSGQKVYARGADAVVLAMVSAGAEIIADGSIHVYAPLRGRALAGAMGDTRARIFTLGFEPELVSIAGVWRNFEQGHDRALLRKSVQIRLEVSETGERLQMAVISA